MNSGCELQFPIMLNEKGVRRFRTTSINYYFQLINVTSEVTKVILLENNFDSRVRDKNLLLYRNIFDTLHFFLVVNNSYREHDSRTNTSMGHR